MAELLEPKKVDDRKAKIKARRAKYARMEPGEKKETIKPVEKPILSGLISSSGKSNAVSDRLNENPKTGKELPADKDVMDTSDAETQETQLLGKNDKNKGIAGDPEIKTSEKKV